MSQETNDGCAGMLGFLVALIVITLLTLVIRDLESRVEVLEVQISVQGEPQS